LLYRFENYALDTDRRELRRGTALLSIEPQVFDLLAVLVGNRNRVVSKEDLLASVWGGRIVSESTLGSRINGARRNVQTVDLGANHQIALEVRPAHDPVREYGFLGVVVDTTNLEGSIWTWWRAGGQFHIEKTATIPAAACATCSSSLVIVRSSKLVRVSALSDDLPQNSRTGKPALTLAFVLAGHGPI
jgi:hypothetical protein